VQGGREKIPLNVFVDVWFSPLGLNSLSRAITHAVEIKLVGLYNLGTVNCLSKADFAQALFVRLGLDTRLLNPTSVSKADLFAQRPNDMRMDSSRFVSAAAFDLPTIEEEIENEAKEYL
jgi:dTDP-4-dehydrorhamnose reductase